MDKSFIASDKLGGNNGKNVKFKNDGFESSLMKYSKKELEDHHEIITLSENTRKLKNVDSSHKKIVKNVDKNEELIEELMIDLSSLLVKLRNSLDELQSESCSINNDVIKRTLLDLIRVCISVGTRLGGILEEKCMKFEEKCFVLNKYSLSYNWFTYWNDNFSKSSLVSDETQEFSDTNQESEMFQNKGISNSDDDYHHVCTMSCVKYEKFISDFKMLSKVANSLFNKAFIMSVWNAKSNNFIEIDYYTFDDKTQSNLESDLYCSKEQEGQLETNNRPVAFHFDSMLNIDNNCKKDQAIDEVSMNKDKIKLEIDYEEELNDNLLSNSINCIFLPKMIVCSSSINDFNSDNLKLETGKDNGNDLFHFSDSQFNLRNQSRRVSIIMENIDIESLIECKNKAAKIRHSMIKMREVQTEIYKLIIEGTGEIDYLEEQSALAQINTAQGASSIAEGCKSKARWWPIHGSTAGLVCGGAAGLVLGPFGVSFGAAVGGALGLTFGNIMKNRCHEKMNDIIQECDARASKKNIVKRSNNLKIKDGTLDRRVNCVSPFMEEVSDSELPCITRKRDWGCGLFLQECQEVDPSRFGVNNLVLGEKYDMYISKVALNDILDNVDIIP